MFAGKQEFKELQERVGEPAHTRYHFGGGRYPYSSEHKATGIYAELELRSENTLNNLRELERQLADIREYLGLEYRTTEATPEVTKLVLKDVPTKIEKRKGGK